MRHPHAQVPTSDLHKDLPVRICVRKPASIHLIDQKQISVTTNINYVYAVKVVSYTTFVNYCYYCVRIGEVTNSVYVCVCGPHTHPFPSNPFKPIKHLEALCAGTLAPSTPFSFYINHLPVS